MRFGFGFRFELLGTSTVLGVWARLSHDYTACRATTGKQVITIIFVVCSKHLASLMCIPEDPKGRTHIHVKNICVCICIYTHICLYMYVVCIYRIMYTQIFIYIHI